MTNIFGSPAKVITRDKLVAAGLKTLHQLGWKVERVPGTGKSSIRRATKGGDTRLISIKTTQDTWLAFARTPDDKSWSTLSEVDSVLVVSVDDRDNPKFAQIHLFDANALAARFDRAYAARKAAGHTLHVGRGIWIALYEEEARAPVTLVGAGAGLENEPLARIALGDVNREIEESASGEEAAEEPLTIPEAKRRLARTLGVEVSAITISISA